MNRLTTPIALVALAMTFTAPVGIDAEDLTETDPTKVWMTHLRKCLRKVFSIKASFVQEHLGKQRPEAEKWTGTAEVRRGGRYRLSYKTPHKRLVVSDGATVWAYDRSAKTAYTSVTGETALDDLLALLVGAPTEAGYTAAFLGGASDPATGIGAIELTPIKNHPFLASVVLTLENDCPCIRRILVTYHDGTLTRFTLSDVKTNIGMGKRLFTFTPPGGTRIVNP